MGEIEFSDFYQASEDLNAEKLEQRKEQNKHACFIAWQVGGGFSMSFEAYLEKFNLAEKKEKLTDAQVKMLKDNAERNAEEINNAYKSGNVEKVEVNILT